MAGKTVYFGEYEELTDAFIEQGCQSMDICSKSDLRRACLHLIEIHGETLTAAILEWYAWYSTTRGATTNELRSALCTMRTKTCEHKDVHTLVDQTTSGTDGTSGQANGGPPRSYLTERVPTAKEIKAGGPVTKVVGETLSGFLDNSTRKDVLLYFYRGANPRGTKPCETHAKLGPRFERLAVLLNALPRKPSTYVFGKIDVLKNDLVPPWEDFGSKTSLTLLPAGRKPVGHTEGDQVVYNTTLLSLLEPVERTLREILEVILLHWESRKSREHVGNLARHLGSERLQRAYWWEDEEILQRARSPYDSEFFGKSEL
jgi:hypothetical protein